MNQKFISKEYGRDDPDHQRRMVIRSCKNCDYFGDYELEMKKRKTTITQVL